MKAHPSIITCHSVRKANIDGLVQEWRNSIVNALKLRLSCTKPSIYSTFLVKTVPDITGAVRISCPPVNHWIYLLYFNPLNIFAEVAYIYFKKCMLPFGRQGPVYPTKFLPWLLFSLDISASKSEVLTYPMVSCCSGSTDAVSLCWKSIYLVYYTYKLLGAV